MQQGLRSFPNIIAAATPPTPSSYYLASNLQNPMVHEFDLIVQQQVGKGTVFSLSYLGALGRELTNFVDLNLNPTQTNTVDYDRGSAPERDRLPNGTQFIGSAVHRVRQHCSVWFRRDLNSPASPRWPATSTRATTRFVAEIQNTFAEVDSVRCELCLGSRARLQPERDDNHFDKRNSTIRTATSAPTMGTRTTTFRTALLDMCCTTCPNSHRSDWVRYL